MNIRRKLILISCLISIDIYSQSQSLDLLKNFSNTEMLGFIFFNNNSNEKLVQAQSIQRIVKNDSTIIYLKTSYYQKSKKIGTQYSSYNKNKKISSKFKDNISTFPKRTLNFISNLPNHFSNRKNKRLENSVLTIKDSLGRTIFSKIENWEETYKYDKEGNLIEIISDFKNENTDSSFSTFCGTVASKWTGKYKNNYLVEEETTWENGKTIKSIHIWTNNKLMESICTSFHPGETRKILYSYQNDKIAQVIEYTEIGKVASKRVYEFE
jgi:YD repeat-containing protein